MATRRTRTRTDGCVTGLTGLVGLALIIVGAAKLTSSVGIVLMVAGGALMVAGIAGLIWTTWLATAFIAVAVVMLTVVVAGLVGDEPGIAAIGAVGVGLVVMGAGVSRQLVSLRRELTVSDSQSAGVMLRRIHEHVMLSDTAKRALFRQREIELLRRAASEEIERGDYDGAMRLCEDMAELFGQREEAEEFRARILNARHEHDEHRMAELLDQLDEQLDHREWGVAHQLAARIKRLYPESHLLQGIDQRILRAREDHQQELVHRLMEHADQGEFGVAMELLKELDRYMGRAEAASLGPVADRVVTGWRDQLAGRFKAAVAEHRWQAAVTAGDQLIDEFPRSRASEEARTVMETIRVRAQGASGPPDSTPG